MSNQPGKPEVEIKLRIADAAAATRRILEAGFAVHRARVFERNDVYDSPAKDLRTRGAVLRIRTAGDRCTVTYKSPGEAHIYKVRPEFEFTASDPVAVADVFFHLGFSKVFRYEKYRTELKSGEYQVTVTLDETPIGTFMEIEGEPADIDRTAARLGFSRSDYITASYGSLYADWCAAEGVPTGDMVFKLGELNS